MTRTRRRRIWSAVTITLLCLAALGWGQRHAITRLALVAGVEALAHVRLSFDRATLTADRATFDGLRVTSFRGEPIAEIPRLDVAYDLRDLLGGRRRFGLQSVDVESPHVTIVRRPDGSYNVPIPQLNPSNSTSAAPLILRVRVRNGSIAIVDESPAALPNQRHLYVDDLEIEAALAAPSASHYTASLRYGERAGRLYPIAGRGSIDPADGYANQQWNAPELPIAAAVNFFSNSSAMRLRSGRLENVDARSFGIRDASGALQTHLAATAMLTDASITIAGLARPIANVHGRVDAYDDGLLTNGLEARIAGIAARVTGGVYGLRAPRIRLAVRGSGDLAQLRTAFTQARRLPMRGVLDFTLLVQGTATKPVTWVALQSPRIGYAAASFDRVRAVAAFDGREADIVNFGAAYGRADAGGRGRVALQSGPNAVEMLLRASSPAGGTPYVSRLLPALPLDAVVLATADDPRQIGVRGVLQGRTGAQRLDAIFDVDGRGTGSIGPLDIETKVGSLYARVALDRPHNSALGIVDARNFALAPIGERLDATLFGQQTKAQIEATGEAKVGTAWGAGRANVQLALRNGALRGSVAGNLGNVASFGAILGGTPSTPQVAGTVVVAGGRFRDFDINGNAGLLFDRSVLHVHDAELALGPLFVGVAGKIAGIAPAAAFAPRYDLAAQIHSSDVRALVAGVQPQTAQLVQGSIDADVRIDGSGTSPAVSGALDVPEGSINGLSFRDLRGTVSGDSTAFALTGGHVVVGTSAIALSGSATPASAEFAVNAPHLDLADINDFFDQGDTFAGTGSLAVRAHLIGKQVVATDGSASFSGARVRRIALGRVAAQWRSAGESIVSTLHVGGPAGELAITGSVTPIAKRVDLHAGVRGLDLASWLPMLGLNAPVTGRLDAQADIAGTYPDVAMQLHAAMFGGTAGPLTIERFELSAAASHGRGTITSAVLDLPSLATVGSGTFGLRADDSLALVLHSTSPDLRAFLDHAGAKNLAVGGMLDSTLRIGGTVARPHLSDAVTLQQFRYGNLALPRVAAQIDADRRAISMHNGEIDFAHGRALLAAAVPIHVAGRGIAIADAPISASLTADDVELSNFADLLPKATQLAGRVDGRISARGTARAPQFGGRLELRDGMFDGPMERSPITGIAADMALRGREVDLNSHAFVGTGALTAHGVAELVDLRSPADAEFTIAARADNARLDLPAYFQGTLNGAVSMTRSGSGLPSVSGDLSVLNARIPLTTLLNRRGGPTSGPGLPDVAFQNVRIAAGPNVRVQSANVDVGATGEVRLGGTLEAPTLAGAFRSTGGSLSFYRNFNIERSEVTFDPSNGVIPDVNAVATTYVADPATAVRLHVTGAVTDMNLALESDPPYSREQILGLLVGAQQFGAVRGVQTSGGSVSAGSAAQSLAFGQLNTAFTRNLLEPLSASLGSSLGFTEVQITSDIQTGLGVNAVKAFGKYVNAIFAQSFGYPRTQSVGLEAHPDIGTVLRLTAYSSTGPSLFAVQQPQPVAFGVLNLNPLTAYTPVSGSNGVTFAYQRKFP
ncbi:MAG: translocation/assembly module TamB domain-containing protein [Candidatus Cybelea sp.]